MSQLRSERKRQQKKDKKKRRVGRIVGIVLLLIAAVLGFFVWRVYDDITSTTDSMYTEVEKDDVREEPITVDSGDDPFSVLLMGIDTGAEGRVERGRSDTMMVMTVNPNTNQTVIASIPRDTYTKIIGRGTMDKINHAYAFGQETMAINTVQNLLDIPIDYYVSVDMQGLTDLIDALGGIQVTPPLTFSQDGYTFTEGVPVNLDGEAALAYSRMRKQDPEGDYGRQARQRQIIEASMKKVASFSSIMNYSGVLSSMESNVSTNLAFDDMVDVFQHYRGAASNVEQIQLEGSGTMIDGIYYDIISDEELSRVTGVLKDNLEI